MSRQVRDYVVYGSWSGGRKMYHIHLLLHWELKPPCSNCQTNKQTKAQRNLSGMASKNPVEG